MRWTTGHKYEDMLAEQKSKNDAAFSLRKRSLDAWATVADRLDAHFQLAAKKAEEARWFDAVYVWRSDKHRTIQLFFGKHPSGGTGEMNIEEGATAVVSQGLDGTIMMILYPYGSKAHRRLKAHLVWHVTSHPMSIKDGLVFKFIRDFLIYVRVSSALFVESNEDYRRVERLENLSRELEGRAERFPGKAARLVLAAGSALLVVLFLSWIRDKDGLYEPWIGLVSLGTAWLAGLVREKDDELKRARISEREEDAARNAEASRIAT